MLVAFLGSLFAITQFSSGEETNTRNAVSISGYTFYQQEGRYLSEVENEGIIYTAGFGFGTKWFQLDISGQYSSKTGEFEGDDIPAYGRAQLALVSKWM